MKFKEAICVTECGHDRRISLWGIDHFARLSQDELECFQGTCLVQASPPKGTKQRVVQVALITDV